MLGLNECLENNTNTNKKYSGLDFQESFFTRLLACDKVTMLYLNNGRKLVKNYKTHESLHYIYSAI